MRYISTHASDAEPIVTIFDTDAVSTNLIIDCTNFGTNRLIGFCFIEGWILPIPIDP